ncbi:hypothetical protein [Rhodococcus sp. IEGM 1408]|uniref:hypothetical protein n=1 Tax=Rhodococcus sp. IEGM 1408 TaxID=3082220 RepID=UPI0029555E68|nr:hypothetical protein [Rhodococcus sp. IEGM 1408]MDV7999881.1 hypothetical protein [Rhodococcus sp. IEGM 1408]
MNTAGRILLGLLLFNAISAAGGGIALMTGLIPEQRSWIEHTDFSSLYLPGVILLALVGGSALFAATAMFKRSVGWQASSILSGIIMVVWIIAEIASIRGFHVLQVVYILTGAAVIWFTPATEASLDNKVRLSAGTP